MSRHGFQIEQIEVGDVSVLRISGIVDEHADMTLISGNTESPLWLDVEGIGRINSLGVHTWSRAMSGIAAEVPVYFFRCSTAMVEQFNQVLGLVSHARIVSFHAPLICENCDEPLAPIFMTADCLAQGGRLPVTLCPTCEQPMLLDDLEDYFLRFLQLPHDDLPAPPY